MHADERLYRDVPLLFKPSPFTWEWAAIRCDFAVERTSSIFIGVGSPGCGFFSAGAAGGDGPAGGRASVAIGTEVDMAPSQAARRNTDSNSATATR